MILLLQLVEPYKPAHLGTAREKAILSQRVGTTVHGSIQLTSSEKVYVQHFENGTISPWTQICINLIHHTVRMQQRFKMILSNGNRNISKSATCLCDFMAGTEKHLLQTAYFIHRLLTIKQIIITDAR